MSNNRLSVVVEDPDLENDISRCKYHVHVLYQRSIPCLI